MKMSCDPLKLISLYLDFCWSPRDIRDRLQLPITLRQVQRYVQPYQSRRQTHTDVLLNTLVAQGQDPYLCNQCSHTQPKPCHMRIRRSERPTVRDVEFVCDGCALRGSPTPMLYQS